MYENKDLSIIVKVTSVYNSTAHWVCSSPNIQCGTIQILIKYIRSLVAWLKNVLKSGGTCSHAPCCLPDSNNEKSLCAGWFWHYCIKVQVI